jgi:hypothetical protein
MVLILAANIVEKMAHGIKSSFGQYKNIILPPLLERMKEKKPSVLIALRNAVDALFQCVCDLVYLD